VGFGWALLFVVYSRHLFGRWLPDYYTSSLPFDRFWLGLEASLISPSRGLLVYVPVLVFVAFLLIIWRRHLRLRKLAGLASLVIAAHLIMIAGSADWNGGGCYGARLSTDLAPWFVLLSIIAIQAMLAARAMTVKMPFVSWHAPLIFGAILLLVSIFMNARGAASWDTWLWQLLPANREGRLMWDWRYPQFFAGLIRPPLPGEYSNLPRDNNLDLTTREAEKYLWFGWSLPDTEYRWCQGKRAAITFATDLRRDVLLQTRIGAYVDDRLPEQKVDFKLNGKEIGILNLDDAASRTYSLPIPDGLLSSENVLELDLPNANSPRKLRKGGEPRLLSIHVAWVRLVSESPPPRG
jgi:hypothetical protein